MMHHGIDLNVIESAIKAAGMSLVLHILFKLSIELSDCTRYSYYVLKYRYIMMWDP